MQQEMMSQGGSKCLSRFCLGHVWSLNKTLCGNPNLRGEEKIISFDGRGKSVAIFFNLPRWQQSNSYKEVKGKYKII